MNVEIITTGDEVMQGIIVDTNTSWIAQKLSSLGFNIKRHLSVGDDIDDLIMAFKETANRADAVIVTGGLGPTTDDLTMEVVSKAFGLELVHKKEILDEIKGFFKRIGRDFSSSNEKQALIPKGGIVLPNKVGTAPGVQLNINGATFFFLPGVPLELYQIFDDSVLPWFESKLKGAFGQRVFRCFGLPEASVDEHLRGANMAGCKLSFRVKFPEVLLKIVARGEDNCAVQSSLTTAADSIYKALGDVVYAEDEITLPELVGKMLKDKGYTLSIAESCTGGLVASLITDITGASAYFDRAIVCYSNGSKKELLGVSEDILVEHGAVSEETAVALAQGIRVRSGTTIGLGITGIAGPGGGSVAKPVGTVFISMATMDGTFTRKFKFTRQRVWFKQLASMHALDMVRKYLLHGAKFQNNII